MVRAMALPLLTRIEAVATLARRGVLRPERPDRLVRTGIALWRWGSTLAAAYVVAAETASSQLAVLDDEGALTYGEIDRRTNALARGLAGLGIREGDRVGILARNGRGFVEPVIAVAKLGADVLLLNTSFVHTELEAVLAREQPAALIYDAEFEHLMERVTLPPGMTRVHSHVESRRGLTTVEELVAAGDRSVLKAPGRESRTVILTSGTTGTPKGARLSQPSGLEPLAWYLRMVPLAPRECYHVAAPLFHAHGYGQFVIGAALGSTLVLTRSFDAERTLALLERHEVEAAAVVPVMLKRIMSLPAGVRSRYRPAALKVVLSSGSALSAELARSFMEEFGPVLYNLYGSTEVAWATIANPRDLLDAPGTVGRPPPHTRLAILDEAGRPLAVGRTGRIFVGHEMLFEGYTDGRLRDLTAGMMTAGDLGHVDDDGRLFVDAREDDMIVSGGENVYPGEVESVLAAHPDLEEVAVVGVPDEQFGERLVAFAVPRTGSTLGEADLIRYAKDNLARYKVPREVVLSDDLPRNALGKVVKRALKDAARSAER
jgi:acyl-CoA synthetase (AMP-forming)/AMP-acid ligase II